MELNKRYSIFSALKHFVTSTNIVSLLLEAEDKSRESIILEPPYSSAFREDDITDISYSESGKHILVYRKKDCCDICHFFGIET
jgi:hypothetical protein